MQASNSSGNSANSPPAWFASERFEATDDGSTDKKTTAAGWQVWSFSGLCGIVVIVLLIVGIIYHVPWVGVFALVSLVPGVTILWLIYWRNHRDKAYLNRVVKFVFVGMAGVLPVFIVEYGLMTVLNLYDDNVHTNPLLSIFILSFFEAFIIAALCEESYKYIVAYLVTAKPEREVPYSLVIYSAAGALGLASLENMMYIVRASWGSVEAGVFTAISRALLAVPLHTTTGVLIGVSLGKSKLQGVKSNYFRTLLIPFLLHGTYDFCTMFPSFYYQEYQSAEILVMMLVPVAVVIGGALFARRQAKAVLEVTFEPVPLNTVEVQY